MLVLHALGIPMPAVLKMATLNDARAIGREALYGTVEKGKRADLVIFAENPLERAEGLVGDKLVVKDWSGVWEIGGAAKQEEFCKLR